MGDGDVVVWIENSVCGKGEGEGEGEGGFFGVAARWLIWCCVIRFADGGF